MPLAPEPSRILIVEDEAVVARDIAQQLGEMGYLAVGHSTTAEDGIRLAGELRPNLVLMDIKLAGELDGVAAAQIIRERFALPVVFLTAFAENETLAQAKLSEPYGYVLKPFSERELHTVIQMALYKHQVETKLQRSEERLRLVLLGSTDAVWDHDLIKDEIFHSPRWWEMVGYTPGELPPRADLWLHLMHPDDVAQATGAFETACRGNTRHYEVEARLRHKSGHYVPVLSRGVIVRDDRGNATRVAGTNTDLTERKQAEEARLAALSRLQKIASRVPGFVYEYRLRPDGTSCFPFASEGIRDIFRVTPDQVREDAEQLFALFHPDDRDHVRSSIFRSAREMTPWRQEFRTLFPDGTVRWLLGSSTPAREADGAVLWHGFVTDVTERHATEHALRLRGIALDSAANAIVITDRQGIIEWANPAFTTLSGWTLAEAAGKNPRDLVKSGEHDAAFFHRMWSTLLAGQVWRGEITNRRKDGVLRTEDMTVTPVRDERGEIRHYIAIKQDITDQKAMESHFLKAQRVEAIGSLTGGIAHDLNNILAPITIVAEVLRDKSADEADRELLAMIHSTAKRGAEIIKQLLTFSRGLEGERTPIQVRHLIGEVVGMMRETFPRDIELKQSTPGTLWTVSADPTQLHQVILNLCVNARDAMPSGGHLAISAANLTLAEGDTKLPPRANPGPYLVIEVSDTGHGIPPDIRHRIFDPFFTTKPVGKGTGLGLSTVLGIVHGHGGFVDLDSSSRSGSTFKVYLPALPDGTPTTAAAARPPPAPFSPAPQPTESILVVDDERTVRDSLRLFLERHNYRVITATDGESALAEFLRHRAHLRLVVTDLMMPKMNGVTLIRTLRAIDPKIKVIASSGLIEVAERTELAALGITEILPKPYNGADLLEIVQRRLSES